MGKRGRREQRAIRVSAGEPIKGPECMPLEQANANRHARKQLRKGKRK